MQSIIIWLEINTSNFLREWQISSFAVQAALLIFGFAIFFKKGIGVPEIPDLRAFYYRLAWFFIIFCFSIILNVVGVYYASNPQLSYTLKTLSIVIGLLAIILLFQKLEKLEIISAYKKIKFIMVGLTIFLFFFSWVPDNLIAPIVALPIWFLIPLIFFYISYHEKEGIRFQSLFLAFGFLLFFGGLIVLPDIFDSLIPNIRFNSQSIFYIYYNFISCFMVYAGLILILVFGRINLFKQTFFEKINSIYILRKNGENIIHKALINDIKEPFFADKQKIEDIIKMPVKSDKTLRLMFENLIKLDRTMKIIEKNDKIFYIKKGINVNALLITDERATFYENRLKDFLRDFEVLYGDFLRNWTGNLEVFESAYSLIDRYFQPGGE